MIVVGISSGYHDSSVAVVVDGEVKASVTEERLSLQKHDSSFPALSLNACLNYLGITKQQIDRVAFYEDPALKFTRVLAAGFSRFPRGWRSFAGSMKEMAFSSLLIKHDIFRETGVSPSKIHFVPHHLSHASCAFATSPYNDAAILVIDAVGEWACTSLFHGKQTGTSMTIEPLDAVSYPHSLGFFYSAFTAFLGFRANDGECNLMALAAFGRPIYREKILQVLKLSADGTYELDLSYFDFSTVGRLPLSKKFISVFGAPRSPKDGLAFSIHDDSRPDPQAQAYADLAASVQEVLEEAVLGLCGKIKQLTGARYLCLAGGVALNSSLNGRVMREAGFDGVFIPPDTGDGGGAMGAALYLCNSLDARKGESRRAFTPYQGLSYENDHVHTLLDHWKPTFRATTNRHTAVEEGVLSRVCEDLSAGKVVGWLQGRFELGPRALGNRSLLIDPKNRSAAKKLSRIKSRAAFRPYACTVTAEHAARVLPENTSSKTGVEWMSSVHSVKNEAVDQVREAMHVNQTTRPQVLARAANPTFHKLLEAWGAQSGLEALLNTSFNASGYPMVASPVDALAFFARSEIDTLVVGNTIVQKERNQ